MNNFVTPENSPVRLNRPDAPLRENVVRFARTPSPTPRPAFNAEPPLAPVRERMVARPVNPGFTVYEFLQNPTHPPTNGPADV